MFLERLFGRKKRPEPATHDYRERRWGHDYTFEPNDGGLVAKMAGWGHGIRQGDYLILEAPADQGTRYRVREVRYCADPSDMWFAKVEFAPRSA